MKCRKMTMVGILIATLILAGCSANRVSLADQALYSLKNKIARKLKFYGLMSMSRMVKHGFMVY